MVNMFLEDDTLQIPSMEEIYQVIARGDIYAINEILYYTSWFKVLPAISPDDPLVPTPDPKVSEGTKNHLLESMLEMACRYSREGIVIYLVEGSLIHRGFLFTPGNSIMEACKVGNVVLLKYLYNFFYRKNNIKYNGPYDQEVLNQVVQNGNERLISTIKKLLDNEMDRFNWQEAFLLKAQIE